VSRWDTKFNLNAEHMWVPGHEHGPLVGYVVMSYTTRIIYSEVFKTRGEANRWMHSKYEHESSSVGATGRIKTHIVRTYPGLIRIVRIERDDGKRL
jgi:hypothetical protein